MRLYSAKILINRIEVFKKNLETIDLVKADNYRNGAYSKALSILKELEEGKIDMEDIDHPDNTLRNIMMLSALDKTDYRTRKEK